MHTVLGIIDTGWVLPPTPNRVNSTPARKFPLPNCTREQVKGEQFANTPRDLSSEIPSPLPSLRVPFPPCSPSLCPAQRVLSDPPVSHNSPHPRYPVRLVCESTSRRAQEVEGRAWSLRRTSPRSDRAVLCVVAPRARRERNTANIFSASSTYSLCCRKHSSSKGAHSSVDIEKYMSASFVIKFSTSHADTLLEIFHRLFGLTRGSPICTHPFDICLHFEFTFYSVLLFNEEKIRHEIVIKDN